MTVRGLVIDATTDQVVRDARVTLLVANEEFATVYTDPDGRFEHSGWRIQPDRTLICRVSHDHYQTREVTHHVGDDRDVPTLEVRLEPKERAAGHDQVDFWMGVRSRRTYLYAGTIALLIVTALGAFGIAANGAIGLIVFLVVAPLYAIVSAAIIKGYLPVLVNAAICSLLLLIGILGQGTPLARAFEPAWFIVSAIYLVNGAVTTVIARALAGKRPPAS